MATIRDLTTSRTRGFNMPIVGRFLLELRALRAWALAYSLEAVPVIISRVCHVFTRERSSHYSGKGGI